MRVFKGQVNALSKIMEKATADNFRAAKRETLLYSAGTVGAALKYALKVKTVSLVAAVPNVGSKKYGAVNNPARKFSIVKSAEFVGDNQIVGKIDPTLPVFGNSGSKIKYNTNYQGSYSLQVQQDLGFGIVEEFTFDKAFPVIPAGKVAKGAKLSPTQRVEEAKYFFVYNPKNYEGSTTFLQSLRRKRSSNPKSLPVVINIQKQLGKIFSNGVFSTNEEYGVGSKRRHEKNARLIATWIGMLSKDKRK
ncbi:hypothetical protein [Psittacicella hinzii]